jgi:hypothetical protein
MNIKMLLNCFACYVQSDWPKKVISVMITSIYIYNACDPLCFFSSNLPCHNLAVKGTGERCDFNQIAGNIAYLIVMSYSILNLIICGVMVSMLASRVQAKDCKIGICSFSAKNAALRKKSKDRLARNRDNVSEWGDISIRGLLFQ